MSAPATARSLHDQGGEDGLIADFLDRNDIPRDIDPDKPLDPKLFSYTDDQFRPVGFVKSFAELTAAEGITPRQLPARYAVSGADPARPAR